MKTNDLKQQLSRLAMYCPSAYSSFYEALLMSKNVIDLTLSPTGWHLFPGCQIHLNGVLPKLFTANPQADVI